jgi:hypothetical protein
MKKIIFLTISLFINNKNNYEFKIDTNTDEQKNLEIKKEEITNKIKNLKTAIISEEQIKGSEIIKIKNDIENAEKELKDITLTIMNTEIELLDLVFNKEQIAFLERNTQLEEEIKTLKNTQDSLSNELKEKKEKLEILNNKKTTLNQTKE